MKLNRHAKYIVYLILILLSFNLISCSKQDNKTHIKLSTWGSETEINILKPLIEDFNATNTDIKVELLHIPHNYFQKLHMLVAANLTPDVMFLNNLNIPVYASGNILLDLDTNLNKSSVLTRKSFFPEALKSMSYNNKLLAIPRDISNVVIYYNKDLFDKYNVSYPAKEWTFEDLKKTAEKLTIDLNNDKKTDIFGISFQAISIYYLPFAWSNGGYLFDKEDKKLLLSKKPACEGLQFFSNLRNKYNVAPKAAEAGNSTMAQMFIQGKLAMFISGRWSVPRFRKDIPFKWDVINFPNGPAGSIIGIDGSGWAINAKSKHKKEAWKLIEYLASYEAISKFSQTGLIVPSREDVAHSKSFLNNDLPPENAKIFIEITKSGYVTPQINRWNEVIDTINLTLEPVWNGNKNACKALHSIETDINELLE